MVKKIETVEPKIETVEPVREFSWAEISRYQLTGQYPEWYTPPKQEPEA
jgi:hypothetical protein